MEASTIAQRVDRCFVASPQEISDLRVKVALVVALFNRNVTQPMAEQCRVRLGELGVRSQQVALFFVPGALEVPLALHCLIQAGVVDGAVGVGCVIKGATYHYDVVLEQAVAHIIALSASGQCVVNAILAAESMDSARAQVSRGRCAAEQIVEAIVWSRALKGKRF